MHAIRVELRWCQQARSQRPDRSHSNINLLVPEPPQCGCTSLLDVRMRRETRIRIGFPGGKRRNAFGSICVELAVKIRKIRKKRLNTSVLRCNHDERPLKGLP